MVVLQNKTLHALAMCILSSGVGGIVERFSGSINNQKKRGERKKTNDGYIYILGGAEVTIDILSARPSFVGSHTFQSS